MMAGGFQGLNVNRSFPRRNFLTGALASSVLLRAAADDVPSRNYRACIIGHTGRGDYGHRVETAFQKFPNITVAAVADPDEKGRVNAQKKSGATRAYASWREMLETEKPNLVGIGMRHVDQRAEIVPAVAAAGAHIFMEKPLAGSLVEADAIVAACEKNKVKLSLAHQMRLVPQIVHLKKLLGEGLIGDILEVRTRGKEDKRAGGEDLMVLGWHCLYLMRYFAGEPRWCFARVTENGRDITAKDGRTATEPLGPVAGDTIHASYAFDNGVQGFFASQKAHNAAKNSFQFAIYGSKGAVQFTVDQEAEVYYLNDPAWIPGKSSAQWQPLPGGVKNAEPHGLKGMEACNRRLMEDLLRAIETNTGPVASAAEGRAVLEMIMAVYASQFAGGRISFPLKDREHPLNR